ncbi:signal peptide peptidase SppA [bacterium]|nr:signal peptide peptidase SppA [bacterium]
MKKFTAYSLGCLTSIVLIIFIIVFSIFGLTKLARSNYITLNANTLLSISLSGPIPEYSRFSGDNMFYNQASVVEIIEAIKIAKTDQRIDGILLQPEMTSLGYASLNEIIYALEDFKKTGKPVIAYLTMASNNDMLLASVANEITISASSSAGLYLKGFGVNMAYYKNMFDNLGIKMHVVSAGKYKDYGTQYSHDSMSDETKENLDRVLKARYDLFVNQLSKNLNLSPILIEGVITNEKFMFLDPVELERTGIIEMRAFETDFLQKEKNRFENVIDYKKYLASSKSNKLKTNNIIAVLYLNGSIMPFESDFSTLTSDWIEDAVEEILKNQKIKACVIRVNSPGGSALESEEILQILKKLKEKMPVVVSMGDVAASGGYMISTVGSKIFADPYSITGSIGVVQMVPDAKKLQEKIGINHESLEYGKKSTWLNTLNGVSEQQLSALKSSADLVYDSFKKIVKDGRDGKFTTLDDVEKVAQGQIWDAESAKNNGLIDEVGNLKDAITYATKLANLQEDYTRENFPVRKNFLEYLIAERFGSTQIKNLLLKNTSETLFQQKMMLDNFKQHQIQTILPMEFEN